MSDIERDLAFVSTMAAELKPYLLSDTLYWSLGAPAPAHRPLLKGTLGGLLFRLYRLEASRHLLTPEQRQQLHEARSLSNEQLQRWVVQAERKATREIKSRLNVWGAYLEECQENPARYAPEYPVRVEERTILVFLFDVAGRSKEKEAATIKLSQLDRLLRGISRESDFVWDGALQPAFPRDRFWWLYVRPVEKREESR